MTGFSGLVGIQSKHSHPRTAKLLSDTQCITYPEPVDIEVSLLHTDSHYLETLP